MSSSSSSSDDDSYAYCSPVGSPTAAGNDSDSDGGGVDVFNFYQKQKEAALKRSAKKEKEEKEKAALSSSQNSNSGTPAGAARKSKLKVTKTIITSATKAQEAAAYQKKKQAMAAAAAKSKKSLKYDDDSSSSSSSDDDDSESESDTKKTPSASSARKRPSPTALSGLDSDDEGEKTRKLLSKTKKIDPKALSSTSKATLEALEKANAARQALLPAQYYHAEDYQVQVEEPPAVSTTATTLTTTTSAQKKQATPKGSLITLTCKVNVELNGKAQPEVTHKLDTYDQEPLRMLIDKIRQVCNLPQSAVVQLKRNGTELSGPSFKTPKDYGLRSRFVLQVTAKATHIPTLVEPKIVNKQALYGPLMSITLRQMIKKDSSSSSNSKQRRSISQELVVQIRQKEPLQELLKQYQAKYPGNYVLKFDGEVLNLTTTPLMHDMESEDMIDVVVA